MLSENPSSKEIPAAAAAAAMFRFTELVLLVASWSLVSAHTVIVYPGWRGNNIIANGTVSEDDQSIKPGSIGINYENETQSYGFPYGMQWMYPCMYPPQMQSCAVKRD